MRIHSGNGLHEEMDQRAIACFDQALEDVGLARDKRLRRMLHDYFAWATPTTMSRYHHSPEDVPDGLHIPKWFWNGGVGYAMRPEVAAINQNLDILRTDGVGPLHDVRPFAPVEDELWYWLLQAVAFGFVRFR